MVLVVLFSPADHLNLYRAQTNQVVAPGTVVPDNPCYDTVSVSPQPALVQSASIDGGVQAQAAGGDPPDTIDGAKHPELIPDEVAYRLIFLAVAEPEGAPAERTALARAKIAPARLSEDDAVAFLSLLTAFRKQFDALMRMRPIFCKVTSPCILSAPLPNSCETSERNGRNSSPTPLRPCPPALAKGASPSSANIFNARSTR